MANSDINNQAQGQQTFEQYEQLAGDKADKYGYNGPGSSALGLALTLGQDASQEDKEQVFGAAQKANEKAEKYQKEHAGKDGSRTRDQVLEQSPLYEGVKKQAELAKDSGDKNSAKKLDASAKTIGAIVAQQNGVATLDDTMLVDTMKQTDAGKEGFKVFNKIAGDEANEMHTDLPQSTLSHDMTNQMSQSSSQATNVKQTAYEPTTSQQQNAQGSQFGQSGTTVVQAQPGTTIIISGSGQGLNRGVETPSIQADPTSFNPAVERQFEGNLVSMQQGQLSPNAFVKSASRATLGVQDPVTQQLMAQGIQNATGSNSRLQQQTPEAQMQAQQEASQKKALNVDKSKEAEL